MTAPSPLLRKLARWMPSLRFALHTPDQLRVLVLGEPKLLQNHSTKGTLHTQAIKVLRQVYKTSLNEQVRKEVALSLQLLGQPHYRQDFETLILEL